jgi:DNA-binding phage protein
VTRRSGATSGRQPVAFLAEGAWPDGALEEGAPVAAEYVKVISSRLRDALADQNVVDVAARAGLARSTIYDVLGGTTWPDIVSIAQLEVTLNARLWPSPPSR